ncbi:MAG: tetratricopeptide repeat protein [Burkholderiales bacterium]|nr:tetratricopeptide repeat protein [Burkholderiales bacterium]
MRQQALVQVYAGDALAAARRLDAAVASYDRALALDPGLAIAHFNRAQALHGLRRFKDALAGYDAVIAIAPGSAEAWNNRGHAQALLGRVDDALASWDRALALRPGFAEAAANRAAALQSRSRDAGLAVANVAADAAKARVALDAVLATRPDFAEARNNRAGLLRDLGRYAEALADYDAALAANPELADAHLNRALLLAALGRRDEALAGCDEALARTPDFVAALVHRGSLRAQARRHAEAAGDFERALAIEPGAPALPGLLLQARANCCDWAGRDVAVRALVADARSGVRSAAPLQLLALTDTAADQAACARTWVRATMPAAPPLWRGERYTHTRIRVAYLSSDLDEHAVAYLLAGVIEGHDRDRFEPVAVSSGPDPDGGMRARLKGAFERFVDVRGRSDREVAVLLREQEIDIAVDLNGHTLGSRTGALALRPAPVQVSYLGYPGTLGADFVDYVLADRFVIPGEQRAHYAERVVWLPDAFQANDRRRKIATRAPVRAEAGLPEKGVVFCAFNNSYKITPAMFDVWMRVLRYHEASTLWLLGGEAVLEHNLRAQARRRGVDSARLVFAQRLPYAEHLARLRLADLFLDTFPFNGGTTASDALRAGLPVLTLAGGAMASRMAGSLLHAIGLPELVTSSEAAYETMALALAYAPERIAALKATLAVNRDTHPLFDTDRFRRHLEAAYIAMVERSRAGKAPAAFAVTAIA